MYTVYRNWPFKLKLLSSYENVTSGTEFNQKRTWNNKIKKSSNWYSYSLNLNAKDCIIYVLKNYNLSSTRLIDKLVDSEGNWVTNWSIKSNTYQSIKEDRQNKINNDWQNRWVARVKSTFSFSILVWKFCIHVKLSSLCSQLN